MARKKSVTSSMNPQERANTPFACRFRELATDGKAIAAHLGVSMQAVSQYKNGDHFPDVGNLTRIADFYSVSVDYLLGRTDIKSAVPDVQTACEVTGLSERAVNRLSETKYPDPFDIFQPVPHPMTVLLESDSFPELRKHLSWLLFSATRASCNEDHYDMQELRVQRAFNRFLAEIREVAQVEHHSATEYPEDLEKVCTGVEAWTEEWSPRLYEEE